ncbi:hypothetical protein EDB84DRAFT_1559569 [Lactarius hengduanensis]|nr:hypothetical protein EDB84DRAFT_1559569 [Lactarius hengduanensis]
MNWCLQLQLADSLAGAMQLGTAVSVLRVILGHRPVKSNKDSCLRLARRATAFVLDIRDTMDGKWDPAPPSLKESLLPSIKDWMCDLAKTNMFTRFVKKDRIKDKITDFELQLIDTVSQFQRKKDDLEFLKSVWDARFPQLYGVSQQTSANPEFVIIHNVGITDIRAFITPYLQQGHLLEVAAIATRIAEHLRVTSPWFILCRNDIWLLYKAGLTMLASTGRWPAIYDQQEQPSLAMLSSLVVNNRGNLVIGGDIASDQQPQNHRGPLVWLCHEASAIVVPWMVDAIF